MLKLNGFERFMCGVTIAWLIVWALHRIFVIDAEFRPGALHMWMIVFLSMLLAYYSDARRRKEREMSEQEAEQDE